MLFDILHEDIPFKIFVELMSKCFQKKQFKMAARIHSTTLTVAIEIVEMFSLL